ncbi:hypothetical protein RB200_28960 [Streptomyces sp. PmtG]
MRRHLLLRFLVTAAAALSIALVGPGAQATPSPQEHPAAPAVTAPHDTASQDAAEGHGITAEQLQGLAAAGQQAMEPPPGGWPVPSDRSYYLTASCGQHAAAIARGAAAWANLDRTQGSGTPVECRNSYITDCGGGGRIVGCNWGRGQRIALFMGGVGDQALLAAHEFGHDWYNHSSYRCAGWTNAQHVMAPSICSYTPEGAKKPIPID